MSSYPGLRPVLIETALQAEAIVHCVAFWRIEGLRHRMSGSCFAGLPKVEPNETFLVILSNPKTAGGTATLGAATGIGTILYDD